MIFADVHAWIRDPDAPPPVQIFPFAVLIEADPNSRAARHASIDVPVLWTPQTANREVDGSRDRGIASEVTYGTFDLRGETQWELRAIKQKAHLAGVSYILQEIYGIEREGEAVSVRRVCVPRCVVRRRVEYFHRVL